AGARGAPPPAPSRVLLGLTASSSFRRPHARPAKYPPVSDPMATATVSSTQRQPSGRLRRSTTWGTKKPTYSAPSSERPSRFIAPGRSSCRQSASVNPATTAIASPAPHTSGRRVMTPAVTESPHRMPTSRSTGATGRAIEKYSCSATAATAPMKPANSGAGRYSMITQSDGSAIAAVRTLVRSTQALARRLLRRATEAAMALLEEGQRLEELALAEVRPHGVGHVELGVGELPEEEVADAHLAARPD